ncbi:hypothetical protein [Aeribacillus pallidus]|jgi:hypothetical protein|uniref:hypothetical protein n=1 Tax=Aeribacillus pallidus TaxID=33936 RepID=UPI003D1F9581
MDLFDFLDTKVDLNKIKVELLELVSYLKDEESTKNQALEKVIEIIKIVEECDVPITHLMLNKKGAPL